MAKYILHADRFAMGALHAAGKEVTLPDDFPAGRDMQPVDAAAHKQVDAYNAMMTERAKKANPTEALLRNLEQASSAVRSQAAVPAHTPQVFPPVPHAAPPAVPPKPQVVAQPIPQKPAVPPVPHGPATPPQPKP